MIKYLLFVCGNCKKEIMESVIDDLKINDHDMVYEISATGINPGEKLCGYNVVNLDTIDTEQYDKVVVCGNDLMQIQSHVDFFRQKYNMSQDKCYGYAKFRNDKYEITVNNDDVVNISIKNLYLLNDLEKYFFAHDHKILYKWLHYFDIYDRHFAQYRDKKPVVMEIGIFKGGSLQMWKEYFGEGAHIIGIDIDPETKQYESNGIDVEIGSQEDREFLRELKAKYPNIDILIDDGGHTMNQQITTFEELFDNVSEGGTYLCEDVHTSYWNEYGGGFPTDKSYIEFSKKMIDYVNAWHLRSADLAVNKYTKNIRGIHYYDSVVVIEKKKIDYPFSIFLGN